MAKPVILVVDDDREVLAAVERDLRRHYREGYRVIAANSGAEALEVVREMQKRGSAIALFLVDQRMPVMTGIEFLHEARPLYPEAIRTLLTAYADTDAAIAAINDVGLHQYLRKPWDPPEERLYPVLDDLLAGWSGRVRLPFDGIRIAGTRWCPDSYAAREFLARNQVPYQWVDIDHDLPTRSLVVSISGDPPKIPVILFPDGTTLVNPAIAELAERVGLSALAKRPFYDIVIVGGGPSGLACAVYAASEGLRTLLIEKSAPGGQAGTSSFIENYLGFPGGVTGADLAQRAASQAKRFGAEMMVGQGIKALRREDPYRIVTLANGSEVSCHALVLATGMAVRELEAPGVTQLLGSGIYYGAAMSEAALFRGQDVVVVGGANSAGQGALFFARYARKVTMLVRKPQLLPAMSKYLVDRIEGVTNIEVLGQAEVVEACGNGHLEKVGVRNIANGETRSLDVAAMFVFIGTAPHTESFQGFVELDDKGFVLTGLDLPRTKGTWPLERDPLMFETSVPGVFAVGDVRSGANRRIAAAVGEGSAAIYSVHKYLQTV
ncbi:MAG TPA: FAD-dependent oxidoreductase [Candidatus Eisenbacteria bacterium]|nr:FAD-dependent oxidoreductase [Candidatus Eisenbacteria bacterium]